MSECSAVTQSMPLLLTESLDPVRREVSHQHIENCAVCGAEWAAYKETWSFLGELPEVEVPARVRTRFLEAAGLAAPVAKDNVVAFHRRPAFKWMAQAAAVVILAGGGYLAGTRGSQAVAPSSTIAQTPAKITRVQARSPYQPVSADGMALAETRVLDADALSPEIQGRPNIANVQFVDADPSDEQIGVSFDVTSRWTVTGNPKDKSMVRLLSYMLENEETMTPRGNALDWVRRTYSDPANANPDIANALAKVLRSDSHEGVRIRALETLSTLPPAVAMQTRDAVIDALKDDPNPAVRIKAVEVLANMVRGGGATLDPAMVDTLRQKASQGDENLYVRVKAAEALSNIRPQ